MFYIQSDFQLEIKIKKIIFVQKIPIPWLSKKIKAHTQCSIKYVEKRSDKCK